MATAVCIDRLYHPAHYCCHFFALRPVYVTALKGMPLPVLDGSPIDTLLGGTGQLPSMKQAVVLIHGIGEPVPMQTLRGFVHAVWTSDSAVIRPGGTNQVWSKPDDISEDFELRRLTTAEAKNDKRTDFFEFYWADVMNDTRLNHVVSWIQFLLFRSPSRVPKQLRAIWWLMAVLAAITVGSWSYQTYLSFGNSDRSSKVCNCQMCAGSANGSAEASEATIVQDLTSWFSILGPVAWTGISGFLIYYVGDAARYLRAKPQNIVCRRKVRAAGIELIQRLHSRKKYDRIIIVGHSLGSVIGYDILTHLWPKYNSLVGKRGSTPALDHLEKIAGDSSVDNAAYQQAQRAYLNELQASGCGWLVTDFITLGSPLTHASLLLAESEEDLKSKQVQREFPACPPVEEEYKDRDGNVKYSSFTYDDKGAKVPHHAAVFGPVRWTNLYFPCRATLWGDFVGGPVAPAFGHRVYDVPVETTIRGGFFTHTSYWTMPDDGQPISHIHALRKALRLDENS